MNDVEPLRGRRILVAEDEAATSLMIEDTLREAGYIVVGPVATVHDALALVESEAIDCAILDIELADGKVGPVAEALVKRGVRFVVATGHDPGMIERPYASVPMLGKAFDLGQLLDAVADINRPAALSGAKPRAAATSGTTSATNWRATRAPKSPRENPRSGQFWTVGWSPGC